MKKAIYKIILVLLLFSTQIFAEGNIFTRVGSNIAAYFNTYYNAKVYFNEAQELYNEQEDKDQLSTKARSALNKATKQAEVVIDKFPNSSYVDDAMFYYSVCHFQLGRYERSLKQLETLTLRYPDSPYYFEAKLWISKCHYQMDKKALAYDLLERFLENSKNRAYFSDAYQLVGYLALQEEDSSKALQAFLMSADKADQKSVRCDMYLEAIDIYIDRGEYKDALRYTDRAGRNIKFDEQRAMVQLAYIRAYRLQGEIEKANSYIESSLKDARIAKYWGDIKYEQANIYFDRGDEKRTVSLLRYIVEDPEKIYRNNRDSHAWARAAYRLGRYYTYERSNLDSAKYYFKYAQSKRRQSREGSLATDYMLSMNQLDKINKNLGNIINKSPELADSAWVYYEYLADSTRAEEMAKNILLADTLTADSIAIDSLLRVANTDYHYFQKELSIYKENSIDYTEALFNLAGLFLFDLHIPDTALNIYMKINREFYYTPAVPKALYSQAYVWEYELDNSSNADSLKGIITKRFPESDISNYILNLVPRDSILFYENQKKIYDIESKYIDSNNIPGAINALKTLMYDENMDSKTHAFIAYKIAWLYDYELSLTENTRDSILFYYHIVDDLHPGTPLARKSVLRIAAIETDINDYFTYLEGDSLEITEGNADTSVLLDQSEAVNEQQQVKHPIRRLLISPGRPRPIRL